MTVTVKIPTISDAEIISATEAAAQHAKELFLRGLPEEAVKFAEHGAQLIKEFDAEAFSKLSSMASSFRAFVRAPAPPAEAPAAEAPAA